MHGVEENVLIKSQLFCTNQDNIAFYMHDRVVKERISKSVPIIRNIHSLFHEQAVGRRGKTQGKKAYLVRS